MGLTTAGSVCRAGAGKAGDYTLYGISDAPLIALHDADSFADKLACRERILALSHDDQPISGSPRSGGH